MSTIHFVYTVPRSSSKVRLAIDKLITLSNALPPLHRFGLNALIPWKKPVRAPHSITYNLLKELKKLGKVKLYSMYEHGVCKLKDGDVFIGQPLPLGGFGSSRADKDDPLSVTSRTLREYKGSSHPKILIMPFAQDELLVSWAKDLAINYADKVVLIGGDIWTKDWHKSPFSKLDPSRVTRIDMGIDPTDYPKVKKTFSPPGQRKFLYIGHTSWYKNTAELERIARALPNFQGGHIGGGHIDGWKKIADFADLTPAYMSKIAAEYDIFVNTSTADAQATTIVEQMCFGMVVASTPETGYDIPSLIRLSTNDTVANVRALTALQNASDGEMHRIAEKNLQEVHQRHSWKQFTDPVIEIVRSALDTKHHD